MATLLQTLFLYLESSATKVSIVTDEANTGSIIQTGGISVVLNDMDDESKIGIDYDATSQTNELVVKIILLGDSAVGKSKYDNTNVI